MSGITKETDSVLEKARELSRADEQGRSNYIQERERFFSDKFDKLASDPSRVAVALYGRNPYYPWSDDSSWNDRDFEFEYAKNRIVIYSYYRPDSFLTRDFILGNAAYKRFVRQLGEQGFKVKKLKIKKSKYMGAMLGDTPSIVTIVIGRKSWLSRVLSSLRGEKAEPRKSYEDEMKGFVEWEKKKDQENRIKIKEILAIKFNALASDKDQLAKSLARGYGISVSLTHDFGQNADHILDMSLVEECQGYQNLQRCLAKEGLRVVDISIHKYYYRDGFHYPPCVKFRIG